MEQTSQKIAQKIASLGLCLFLAACASTPEAPEICPERTTFAPKKATSRPYQVFGVWYYPQPHYEYCEEGLASFYGGGDVFHGRKTATGERFDMNGVTAAHKTIPLPCVAKVTNLENGRELIVKVNDRGPFVGERIIDLSRRSAQLLGFENKGLAKVRVETLVPESLALNGIECPTVVLAEMPQKPTVSPIIPVTAPIQTAALPELPIEATEESSPPPVIMAEAPLPAPVQPEPVASTGIFVSVGEYDSYDKAQAASHSLSGLANGSIGIAKSSGPRPYAPRLGPLPSMAQANQLLDQLVNAGHTITRIVIQR